VKKAPILTFPLTREGIENRLNEMDRKLDRLRSLYESYFMGMERIPPDTLRREMNRMMLEMQQVPIGRASLRFRFQALSQRWVLHMTYWNRTMREIEAGTYRRDMARTQRHLAERGGMITEEEALALGIPKSRVKAFVARQHLKMSKRMSGENPAAAPASAPAASGPTRPSEPPRPGPPPIPGKAAPGRSAPPPLPGSTAGASLPGLSNKDFEGAYQQYMDAHKKLGIEPQAIEKDKLRARLGKQLPKILEEQRCERVRLEIAVEGGKVRLRAWAADR